MLKSFNDNLDKVLLLWVVFDYLPCHLSPLLLLFGDNWTLSLSLSLFLNFPKRKDPKGLSCGIRICIHDYNYGPRMWRTQNYSRERFIISVMILWLNWSWYLKSFSCLFVLNMEYWVACLFIKRFYYSSSVKLHMLNWLTWWVQIMYLDEWGPMDRDHSNSLSGAIEALKASTLRLPVVSGARVCLCFIFIFNMLCDISVVQHIGNFQVW